MQEEVSAANNTERERHVHKTLSVLVSLRDLRLWLAANHRGTPWFRADVPEAGLLPAK